MTDKTLFDEMVEAGVTAATEYFQSVQAMQGDHSGGHVFLRAAFKLAESKGYKPIPREPTPKMAQEYKLTARHEVGRWSTKAWRAAHDSAPDIGGKDG